MLDLGIETSEESLITIDLNYLTSFFKNSNDKINQEMVCIIMQSGERHDVYEKYEDFKKLIHANSL